MESARCLSHASATSSGLCRAPRSLGSRTVAHPRPQRSLLRVNSVADLARPVEAASGSTAGFMAPPPPLNAPSAEELASPVTTVHSPEEYEALLAANPGRLAVLMCKATHCRPCKMFSRKYARAAAQYSDALWLEIFGDETKGTRQMMIDMGIRVTPTFVVLRNGEKLHSHGGINETNLHRYVSKYLLEGEAGYGSFVEPEAKAAADGAAQE